MYFPLFFAALAFVSTFTGGLIALKFHHHLHLIMSLAAGVLLGVVSFDIFPEIIEQTHQLNLNPLIPMAALVGSFLVIHILEKAILMHHSEACGCHTHHHPKIGIMAALALVGHSFLDGIGIGLGFQISNAIGIMAALAIITHDFTDGMNTVTLMLAHKNTKKRAKAFLGIVALAPILGAASTLFFTLPQTYMPIYLGLFAGFLLYIGGSHILPEAHSEKSSWSMIGLTVLGAALALGMTLLAGNMH